MREDWKKQPFEMCIEDVTYTQKIQRKDFLSEGKYPIISQEQDFINGYWNSAADLFKVKTPLVVFGDHTKILKYVDFDFVLGADGVKILMPCRDILPKFFYYQIQTANLDSLGYARHYRLLKKLEIAYPSLSEQQRIVAILDKAFDTIATAKANTEKNLQNARAIFESHLASVFVKGGPKWVKKCLKEVCEKITDGTHQTPTYYDEGVIFLSSRNVTSGKIDWDKIKFIDTKQHLEMHRRVAPRRNDILLAKNGTTGVAAIVDRDVTFDIYVSLALLRPLSMILPEFLLFFINSPAAKEQFNKRLKGIGVPNLHLEEIREVMISFPVSLAEQQMLIKELAGIAAETQRLASLYQQKLTALDALKKSLLHQAFSGQLTAHHPALEARLMTQPNHPSPQSSIILYQTEDGRSRIQCRFENESLWLTQKLIAELFQIGVNTVNHHLKEIYDEAEIDPVATIRRYRIVQTEGNRQIQRDLEHYSLPAILAVGYRVRSTRGTQFRQWATAHLSEYLLKGFTMDDDRLKNPPGPGAPDYFDELLERIRDIRSSERRFYQKVLDIYATSIDYTANAQISHQFFATVQNKIHWATHGHTAAEVIHLRANAAHPLMGLKSTRHEKTVRKEDVSIAKNYLNEDELNALNHIVSAYLAFAELQAISRQPMTMRNWIAKLDDFLKMSGRDLLKHAGKISADDAKAKAEAQYEQYRKRIDALPRGVDDDFDRATKDLEKIANTQEAPKIRRNQRRPQMNEADTRAERIEPQLKAAGWGVVENSKILREVKITNGKIQPAGIRAKPLIADFILVYKNQKLAVIEAKSDELEVAEGVPQAKNYAAKLQLPAAFAANGHAIYHIDMKSGTECLVPAFPTPDQLWQKTFATPNAWRDKFDAVPFEDIGGSKSVRYYQEIAVNRVTHAIAENKSRILLTLATGTGKTFIAFQIAWKLVQSRWNLKRDGSRLPRILFLADRNILADQAYNNFSAFPDDALARIRPDEIAKKGKVPTNATLFFTIFQTFMTTAPIDATIRAATVRERSSPEPQFNFRGYPPDFFDLIIIDECHRGGANDESNWRAILEYFAPAVQLGLTATPKRQDNVDTYKYFGEPVYIYSLKEGINDGFLTPFKVKRIQTTLDTYVYTSDDQIIEGEIEQGRRYEESDFNRIIEIKAREAKRVDLALAEIDPKEKSLVFCATQNHAAAVRDLINQKKQNPDPLYCARVTANDGALGEQYLRDFQDNEKSIPTILTTSQKLSTGVDARNVRNIILMRPINSMIEFKQIIGRGTRLFEGKTFFTILDFVDAYQHFSDPEWDGEPIEPEPKISRTPRDPNEPGEPPLPPEPPPERPGKIKIKLRDGKEREIQHMVATSFWSPDGKPISAEEFMNNLFGEIPKFFSSEAQLRKLWSNPATRKTLLDRLADAGFGLAELSTLQQLINAEKSDIFDVLEYVAYARPTITREARAAAARPTILALLNSKQQEFINFVLDRYIQDGFAELDQEKLPALLTQKYHALADAQSHLGPVPTIRSTFIDFQKHLYNPQVYNPQAA